MISLVRTQTTHLEIIKLVLHDVEVGLQRIGATHDLSLRGASEAFNAGLKVNEEGLDMRKSTRR